MESLASRGVLSVTFSLAALAAGVYFFLAGARPLLDLDIRSRFVATTCKVIASGFAPGATRERAHPQIEVTYKVGEATYRSRGFDDRAGTPLAGQTSRAVAQRVVASFPAGSRHACWYDPDQPLRVVLVREKSDLVAAGFAWLLAAIALAAALSARPAAAVLALAAGLVGFVPLAGWGAAERALAGWPDWRVLLPLGALAIAALLFAAWATREALDRRAGQ